MLFYTRHVNLQSITVFNILYCIYMKILSNSTEKNKVA